MKDLLSEVSSSVCIDFFVYHWKRPNKNVMIQKFTLLYSSTLSDRVLSIKWHVMILQITQKLNVYFYFVKLECWALKQHFLQKLFTACKIYFPESCL